MDVCTNKHFSLKENYSVNFNIENNVELSKIIIRI